MKSLSRIVRLLFAFAAFLRSSQGFAPQQAVVRRCAQQQHRPPAAFALGSFASSSKSLQQQQRIRRPSVSLASSTTTPSSSFDWEGLGNRLLEEAKEVAACFSIAAEPLLFLSDESVSPEDIVRVCDEIDDLFLAQQDDANASEDDADETLSSLFVNAGPIELRRRALEFRRYEMLSKLMRRDYDAYVATASFLSPSRIPRDDLPNVQDVVPYENSDEASLQRLRNQQSLKDDETGRPLVADCELDNVEYQDSWLDKLLLKVFRNLVETNTGGVASDKPGIEGLLEQGRTFMLQEGQTPEAQHKMVRDTLGGLMTPVLPPFYRIFMSGIVPQIGTKWDGKQLGPWFYAPFLTSVVTPTFFKFLVGPSRPNRRKDGRLGGLVVEKCKFLQESGCKGLCLHQCKLPAQQFFQDELGLPLTVTPNFETQECQWSFGETPLPPDEDPAFPKGCLVGCQSRKQVAASGAANADLCNA